MKWFFQSAAMGFLALVGTMSLYGQGNSGSAQGNSGTQQGTSGGQQASGSSQGTQSGSQVGGRLRGGLEAGPGSNQGDRTGQRIDNGGLYPENNEPWFANDDLRDELELDDDQIERLRDIHNRTWSELQGRNSNDQLSDEARSNRMRELRNQFDDQFNERSADIFRNDAQRQRFNQLGMQYRGYSAFDNPRLQRQLNLNDTQRRQLQDLNNSWNQELDALRGTYAGDRTGTEQRFNQLRERTRTNFEGILNDQQRTAYDEMIGNRYDFGADSYLGGAANQNDRTFGADGQGSGLGTPEGGVSEGSGLGTPGNLNNGSGLGTTPGTGAGTEASGSGSGTGAGSGSGGSGSGGSGGAGGSGGSGS